MIFAAILASVLVGALISIAWPIRPFKTRGRSVSAAVICAWLLWAFYGPRVESRAALQDSDLMGNARLNAEIEHTLKTKGEHIPPDLRIRTDGDYRAEALILCSRYAKAAARHRSTFNFSRWGSKISLNADKSADVRATFTAKNSFGLELDHTIHCRVSPSGDVTATIAEAR